MAALVTGINVAHEEEEPKCFVAKRGKALALTLGAVIVLGVAGLVAGVPSRVHRGGRAR